MNDDDDYYRRKQKRHEETLDLLIDVSIFLAFLMIFAKCVGLVCEACHFWSS